jgi:septal ring factor EnvC (AmiA/AmiB activator)
VFFQRLVFGLMNPLRRLCVLLLALLPALAGSLPALAASENADPVKTKKELQQVKNRIEQLQKVIKTTQTQRSAAENDLKKVEQEIGATQRKLRDVQTQQSEAQTELDQLRAKQAELNAARERQRNAMRADITAAYRSGRQEYLKLVLNQESPELVSRLMKYYDYFRSARLERMSAFNQTLAEIASNESRIHTRMAELETLKADLVAEQERLQKAQERRKSLLATLDSSLQNRTAQVGQLKANQSNLEKVLRAVQESMADLPTNLGNSPFASLQGKLKWPTQGRMIHRFGAYREQGALRWNGVLIGAPSGSAVRAVHHGRVVFADWMRGFGNLIIVDHGRGYMSLYGHNESLLKSPGDWVRGGETIATSGSSGGQSQPGLYFEIRYKGSPVNPARWCRS